MLYSILTSTLHYFLFWNQKSGDYKFIKYSNIIFIRMGNQFFFYDNFSDQVRSAIFFFWYLEFLPEILVTITNNALIAVIERLIANVKFNFNMCSMRHTKSKKKTPIIIKRHASLDFPPFPCHFLVSHKTY